MDRPIEGWHGLTPTPIQTDADGNLIVNLKQLPTFGGMRRTILAEADTEYSETMPANLKGFLVRLREEHPLNLCFVSGFTTTVYLTIPSGGFYQVHGINITGLVLYMRCVPSAANAEIVYWI